MRDLAAETGETIETIAPLHRRRPQRHVRCAEADITYDLGPASARPKHRSRGPEKALSPPRRSRLVGWGRRRRPGFAACAHRSGSPSSVRARMRCANSATRSAASRSPNLWRTGRSVERWRRRHLEDAIVAAATIGYPMMLKATAGGGRGIRVITEESDLVEAYERTRQEAARSFWQQSCRTDGVRRTPRRSAGDR